MSSLGWSRARVAMKPSALAVTTTTENTTSRIEATMAVLVAARGGRFGARERITRLRPSTMIDRKIARSRGAMMPPIQCAAAPVTTTAMTTRALRAVAGGGGGADMG